MKKLPLILAVISIIAIAILFVLEFSSTDDKTEIQSQEASPGMPAGNIAYVEVDSVLLNFEMYYQLREELMEKQQSSEAELNTKGREYETGARDYEEKVRKGLVTRSTAQQMEQELLQQQQDLRNLANQLESQLMEEERVMNSRILDYIYNYLDEFAAENNFDYVLGKSFGNPVMYANEKLNVTDEVLKGLNFKYNKDKSSK